MHLLFCCGSSIMMIYIFLVLLATVNVVVAQPKYLVFQPKMLVQDLADIGSYHTMDKKRESLTAYIHLPESITFRVRLIDEPSCEKQILIVDGQFQFEDDKRQSYDSLYYNVASNQCYFQTSSSDPMKLIRPIEKLRYVQPTIEETKPYLSIRYFGVKDLTREISSFFSDYKSYYNSHVRGFPATFLVTSPNGDGFLEYSFWCQRIKARESKVLVKALIGEESKKSVTILDDDHGYDPVFDQRIGSLNVHSVRINKGKILGIRVTSVPCLAEVLETGITMYSRHDTHHGLPLAVRNRELDSEDKELMEKVKQVGLRCPHYNLPSSCPKSLKFQVYGMILVKSVNYSKDGEVVDESCPFVVEFQDGNGIFAFKSQKVPKLCTNDVDLWANTDL